jgi:hypothetical protein
MPATICRSFAALPSDATPVCDSSEINAFNPTTGAFEGMIPVDVGAGNTAGGLWALNFGIGGDSGDPTGSI